MNSSIEKYLHTIFNDSKKQLPLNDLYNKILLKLELPLITFTLKATNGNQVKAAEILGLNRNTLRKKIRQLNIPVIRGEE